MPTPRPLRTSEIARAVGVHPNTIRLYETWGFLPPVPRTASGYRLFSQTHLDQMRLARLALHGGWPGRTIRQSALTLVRKAAAGDLDGALELAHTHLALVQGERAQADTAVTYLEKWARGRPAANKRPPMPIREAARLLGLTPDVLRNWEKNGLLHVPRAPHNGYRLYGAPELGRARVIRLLSRAGYSSMAILRMLHEIDAGEKDNLSQVLDTPRPDEDVLTAADRWLTTLGEQARRARQMIGMLEKRIRKGPL
jgi:DNA-binding transcriptional MerR regulator